MVSSKLNDTINYKEIKTIDDEDKGHASTLYEMHIHDDSVQFALGKQKYTYASKNVLFYPIYLVNGGKIKSQIGVFEIESKRALNVLDEDGDIDLSSFDEPLLYSFVTPTFVKRALHVKTVEYVNPVEPDNLEKPESESEKTIEEIELEIEDEDDVITLKTPKSTTLEKATKMVEDGVFEIDTHFKLPALLKQETELDADKYKLEYKKSSKNNWVEDYLKNNNYAIVETESNGDCFFAVIREAYKQIGKITTVQKLRAILARELTDDVYREHSNLYNGFQSEIDAINRELETMKESNAIYEKRVKKTTSKTVRDAIIEEAKTLKLQYKELTDKKKATQSIQNEYVGYMTNIKNIEQFRDYIQTSSFWADAWAISTLERVLNVKIVILSEQAYNDDSLDSVLNCGEINKGLEEKGSFSPDYYIMTAYSGNHYNLITYKSKRIFTFLEIPYSIKILTINKCLEKNAGTYYLIQEFRNMKSTLGIDPNAGAETESDDESNIHNIYDTDLYDKDVQFMFHSKSENSAKPGKGSGETIPKSKMGDYVDLAKNKEWRRKLDDMYNDIVITIDGRKWASVEHYIQGAKYKKGFPDFAQLFAFDSGSEFSKDAAFAKSVGETGKYKTKVFRPKNVKMDNDYDLGRGEEERKLAVKAKFTQNEDMKHILLATKRAELLHFVRRGTPQPDMELMRLRRALYQH